VAAIGADVTEGVVPFRAVLWDLSTDEDDAILYSAWDLDEDGVTDSTASQLSLEITEDRDYVVRLTVSDAGGASDTATITIRGDRDSDADGVLDRSDNCPTVANVDQQDLDTDGQGDACDPDIDGDGVANDQDAFPNDPRYSADTEGDGLPDEWELMHFGDLTTADAASDFDGDGSPDWDEYLYGSDPTFAPPLQRNPPISTYSDHNLALKTDSTVWAWGSNWSGQLGIGDTWGRGLAHAVLQNETGDVLSGVYAIAAGYQHSLALRKGGTVLAWGSNESGQLGDGTLENRLLPVPVVDEKGRPIFGIVAIAAGAQHSLALRQDGTLLAWGANDSGQLGDGSSEPSPHPVRVVDELGDPIRGIVAIAAGWNHSLALRSDGTVLAWGSNAYGQLGDPDAAYSYNPIPARVLGETSKPLTHVRWIASGDAHALAVADDGTVWAWGSNWSGQLGVGDTSGRTLAHAVQNESGQPIQGIAAAWAGSGHSLAVSEADGLWTWGANGDGQLGIATDVDVLYPADTGITGVLVARGGSSHSLALQSDGTLLAWGANWNGQR